MFRGDRLKPEVFGNWLLIEKLSRRSMTEVYRAIELGDKSARSYVVKRVPLGQPASGAVAESLRREAAAVRAEGLINCPRFIASSDLGGLPFLVVEYIEGVSIDRLTQVGKLTDDLALGIGRGLARVLSKLHEAGFVHGDVTPENVLVDEFGEVHLIDFGLAYAVGATRDTPGGKPGYVSSDAALGKPAQPADDIYGWGVVVAEIFLGRHLFHETDLAEAAVRPEALPAELGAHASIAKALSRAATERPDAKELAQLTGAAEATVLGELVAALARAGDSPRTSRSAPVSKTVQGLLRPVDETPAIDPKEILRETKTITASASSFNRTTILALTLGLLFALALGLIVGRRFPVRNSDASITFPMVPPRTEIELDGAIIVVPEPGRALPIRPGKHRVSVQVGRRDATEYEFVAEPGEHIVVVSVNPPRAGLADDPEKDLKTDPKTKPRKNPKN